MHYHLGPLLVILSLRGKLVGHLQLVGVWQSTQSFIILLHQG